MIQTASVVLDPQLPEGVAGTEAGPLDATTLDTVVFPSPQERAEVKSELAAEEAVTVAAPDSQRLLFGRYRRVRELGRGGMGVVWLAQDQVLGIPVALKLVPEELAQSNDELEGLRKEVLRGIALTHPGIVRVYSFERDAMGAAIVMEYVDGESLADLKAKQPDKCFDPEQLRGWLEQLCAVLDYAHGEARIVHRDLKPRNLMVTREGRLKVADFGIASSLAETTCGISVRHDSSGTPPYMSPQQAMGERPSVADDLYSVGATLYDLITGKPPFYRGNIIAQVLQEPAAEMTGRRAELGISGRPEISARWERLLAACLAKQPGQRPPSGAALLALLDLSPHALVPFVPAPEIPMESLRLDIRRVEKPLMVMSEEENDPVVEVVPRPVRRGTVEIFPPQEYGVVAVLEAVRDEAIAWGRRLLYIVTVVAVVIGGLYLLHGWSQITQAGQPQTFMVPMNGPMVQMPAPQGPQTVTVEVHYMQPPGGPMMMPPGWSPGQPLPPGMFPPGMMPPPPPPRR